jgi:hypothetical protein
MRWETDLLHEIFRRKSEERSEDRDNLLELASRHLYGEKIQYALELIQNAEDETASVVTFIFDQQELLVVNDGNAFSADDVWGSVPFGPGERRTRSVSTGWDSSRCTP